jgi:hypothetical protein
MKLLSILAVLILASAAPAQTYTTYNQDVVFAWDYSFDQNPTVTGFNLYVNGKPLPVSEKVTQFTYKNYPISVAQVAATAKDDSGNESEKSNEITVIKKDPAKLMTTPQKESAQTALRVSEWQKLDPQKAFDTTGIADRDDLKTEMMKFHNVGEEDLKQTSLGR